MKLHRLAALMTAAAAVGTLVTGCGGGGGGSNPPATPLSVTTTGTAAKGAALAGAAVSIKCTTGTGVATTGSDGSYSVTIPGAILPCILKIVGTEGSVFHSVVAGSGSAGTFTANVTPLTEMLVAQLAGATPGSFFDAFGASSVVSTAALTQAIDYLRSALAGVTNLSGVNPVSDALVIGNALDLKIDAVVASFASTGVTVQQIAASIAANPSAPSVISAPLAPSSSDCPRLKSGKYRLLTPFADPIQKAREVSIDAAALTYASPTGETGRLYFGGACQFTIDSLDETATVMVSAAGVLVVDAQSKTVATTRRISIGLPDQVLPVSEFAGTWNVAAWAPSSNPATPGFVTLINEVTFNASGQVTALLDCLGLAPCTARVGPFQTFATNAVAGGFTVSGAGGPVGEAFLFKTLAGKTMFGSVSDDGQFVFGTRKEALGAPAVGSILSNHTLTLNGNGTFSPLSKDSNTVTAVDTAAHTLTRLSGPRSSLETLGYDKPRDGLRYRAGNSCTILGVPNNCAEFVQLRMPEIGIVLTISVGTNPATAFYNISVFTPAVLQICNPLATCSFKPAGATLTTNRIAYNATLLTTGELLLTGGFAALVSAALDTAEVYDAPSNTFTSISGRMTSPRHSHTATRLLTGQVLVTGGATTSNGDGSSTAEMYNPATQTFTALAATLNTPRGAHTATLLTNGQVLLTGGFLSNVTLNTAELYNPATGNFTAIPATMTSRRESHTATLLPNGKVLLVGGDSSGVTVNSAELYDPATKTFTPLAAAMTTARVAHTATRLADNRVLVAGGIPNFSAANFSAFNTAELFDPATNSFTPLATTMTTPRGAHTATLLNTGAVLFAGGATGSGGPVIPLNTAEVFGP